jgi:hypothetical protein
MSVWRLQAGWGRGGGDHVIPRRPRRPRRRARRVCPGLGARLAVGGGEERARRPGAHARTRTTPLFLRPDGSRNVHGTAARSRQVYEQAKQQPERRDTGLGPDQESVRSSFPRTDRHDTRGDVPRLPTPCWGIQENTSPSKRRSLIVFSKYVFQGQEIRECRNSETCEVSSSRACRIRETWFGEDVES